MCHLKFALPYTFLTLCRPRVGKNPSSSCIWRVYGDYVAAVERLYGGCWVTIWQLLGRYVARVCGGCWAGMWRLLGGYVAAVGRVYGGCWAGIWRLLGGYMAAIGRLLGEYMAAVGRVYSGCWSVHSLRSFCAESPCASRYL